MDYGRRNRFAPRGNSLFEMQSAGRLATRAMRRRWNFWSQRRCQMGWSFAGREEGRLLQAERSWLGRRLLRVGDFGSSALLLRGTIKAFQMALRHSDEWARRRRHSADWRALGSKEDGRYAIAIAIAMDSTLPTRCTIISGSNFLLDLKLSVEM